MKNSKVLLGIILFSVLGVLFLYMSGFFTEKLSGERVVRLNEMSGAKTMTVLSAERPLERVYTGTVIADQQAALSARLTAKIAEVLFDVGDKVQQGDVLMRLESDDLDARVLQSQESLASNQARLKAARKEYTRVRELVERKLLSQSEFDKAESELKTSQASFRQAQAAVIEAQTTFGFSIITAPFDGVITQRPINKGDTATPGMLLITMYNPETMQLQADIAESQIASITLGTKLSYQLPSYSRNGVGEVVEIAPAADNNSRSFVIKLALNDEQTIYPGTFGKVTVEKGVETVIALPDSALYQVGQLDYVKTVEDGVIKRRLVQLGENNRVRKGVNEGEVILLNPLSY